MRDSSRVNQEGFESWVRLNTGSALAYAWSLLRDHHAAEDIVQDCMCRILAKADRYDILGDGRKILFRSITNACINHSTRLRLVTGMDSEEGRPWGEWLEDTSVPSPMETILGQEMENSIKEGLAQLTMEQRAAIQMKSIGSSLGEIAQALKITVTHAGVLVHRARKSMSRHLGLRVEESIG
ncbi:MAG: RNA polymerase sigma factor [Gemmataceae bacterium]|nr:RNA polymerase sigma factor [Gemmataceae bacterium]